MRGDMDKQLPPGLYRQMPKGWEPETIYPWPVGVFQCEWDGKHYQLEEQAGACACMGVGGTRIPPSRTPCPVHGNDDYARLMARLRELEGEDG